VSWDFGDGGRSDQISPVHVYETPGIYSVDLSITSPLGCMVEANFNSWIEIRSSPTAAFSYFPEDPSNFNPTVDFTNLSTNHVSQQWIFDTEGRSMLNDPTFTFPDTGLYQVLLIAVHENGCRDTTEQDIYVLPRVTFHMPNAFTPNADGKNDEFRGTGYTDGMRAFKMTIWNRWGELLFETESPEEAWNGSRQNRGEVLPNGVYVYQVQYIDPMGDEVELRGFATLVR
jgi:gliding motility-associated-like protein